MPKQAVWSFAAMGALTLCFALLPRYLLSALLVPASLADISWEAAPERISEQLAWLGLEEVFPGDWRGPAFGEDSAEAYPRHQKGDHAERLVGFDLIVGNNQVSDYAKYKRIKAYLDSHSKTFKLIEARETSLRPTEDATVNAVYQGKPLKRFYRSRSGATIMLSFTQDDALGTALNGIQTLKGCGTDMQLYIAAPDHNPSALPDDHCTPLGPDEIPF